MKYIKFLRLIIPFWKIGALGLILNLVGIGLSLANPYLAKLMVDEAYANRDLKLFLILTEVDGAIFLVNAAI